MTELTSHLDDQLDTTETPQEPILAKGNYIDRIIGTLKEQPLPHPTTQEEILAFRKNFRDAVKYPWRPSEEIVATGEDMIQKKEFIESEKMGQRVCTFKFGEIHTSFTSSQ